MYAQVFSGALAGIEGSLVKVETDLSGGLPAFAVVGLPDAAVREARERIRAAMINSGFPFPMRRITVNLSPADVKKEGTHFDLPIAVSLLTASGQQELKAGTAALFGELSLDGQIRPVKGALPLAIGLREQGLRNLILPYENRQEVSLLKDVTLFPARSLKDVAAHLSGKRRIAPYTGGQWGLAQEANPELGDFSDVAGQESVKRALQVAAASTHGILMIGPPGVGKTMMAARLPGILPPLSYEEILEVTRIYSVAGSLEKGGVVFQRPFRSPYHTISASALLGGGVRPSPGEISLAHRGVLFLDELTEFSRRSLELLRQPLEAKKVTISRAFGSVTFPASFLLVAACNPCPCGFLGSGGRPCTCSESQLRHYQAKLSGPLLDRIDMHIQVWPSSYERLSQWGAETGRAGRTSAQLREEVEGAWKRQKRRYLGEEIQYNSQLTPALCRKYCSLDPDARSLMKEAFEKLHLSSRAYQKILLLARTISDLDGVEKIGLPQIGEAIQYRSLDRPSVLSR